MSRPSIVQTDDQLGFHWLSGADQTGQPVSLAEVVASPGSEPDRLLPTHLEAVDDTLIGAAGQFGAVLGGGRPPHGTSELLALRQLDSTLDRLIGEYAGALALVEFSPDLRAGQIIGTAALFGYRARLALGLLGPAPLAGELDEPQPGVVSGLGQLWIVDEQAPWRGGRWIVLTEDGRRLPANLAMLLFDSSGVNKDASLEEHRQALRATIAGSSRPAADAVVAAGAIDWLLNDFLMAHRESPSSAAIVLPAGRQDDAELIISAAATSARLRAANPR